MTSADIIRRYEAAMRKLIKQTNREIGVDNLAAEAYKIGQQWDMATAAWLWTQYDCVDDVGDQK